LVPRILSHYARSNYWYTDAGVGAGGSDGGLNVAGAAAFVPHPAWSHSTWRRDKLATPLIERIACISIYYNA
jgi:hypothetical protein